MQGIYLFGDYIAVRDMRATVAVALTFRYICGWPHSGFPHHYMRDGCKPPLLVVNYLEISVYRAVALILFIAAVLLGAA